MPGMSRDLAGGQLAVPQPFGEVFRRTSWKDRSLFAVSQAGLVNNLNDGVAWGLFPTVASPRTDGHWRHIGWLAAIYPASGVSGSWNRRAFRPHRPEGADRRRDVGAGAASC